MLENRMVLDEIETSKKVCGVCEQCGEDIYEGDSIMIDQTDGSIVHEDCLDDYLENLRDTMFISSIAGEED